MAVPNMNFVGVLQEICSKAHTGLPEYTEGEGTGVFKFTCTLKDWVAVGTGNPKKFAKQNAAKAMLEQIEYGKLLPGTSVESSPEKSSVSKLIEYCTRESKDSPLFSELPKENGLFCCKCSLEDFTGVGKGHSKKEAKEKAAFQVVEHFKINLYHDNLIKSQERKKAHILPIQELHIFCQKKNIALPVYQEEEVKENNVVKYKVTCSVGDLREVSSLCHSKKAAKHEVSTLLLQTLKSNTPVASPEENENRSKPRLRRKIDTSEKENIPRKKKHLCEDSDESSHDDSGFPLKCEYPGSPQYSHYSSQEPDSPEECEEPDSPEECEEPESPLMQPL